MCSLTWIFTTGELFLCLLRLSLADSSSATGADNVALRLCHC